MLRSLGLIVVQGVAFGKPPGASGFRAPVSLRAFADKAFEGADIRGKLGKFLKIKAGVTPPDRIA
ncbi:MAG: hypothetical protein ACLQKK_04710 [Rhodomicrobium sp.]